jgi:hypothetical protein
VLPTIMDELGARIPWKVDGRSALRPARAHPQRTIIAKKFKHTYLVDTPSFERRKHEALERKVGLFGEGSDDIYAFGPRPDLIGERVAGGGGRDVVVERASGFVPTHVAGALPGGQRGGGRVVAVAANGRIVATGVTFSLTGSKEEQYSVVIPERSLHAGRNRISVRLVSGSHLIPGVAR